LDVEYLRKIGMGSVIEEKKKMELKQEVLD